MNESLNITEAAKFLWKMSGFFCLFFLFFFSPHYENEEMKCVVWHVCSTLTPEKCTDHLEAQYSAVFRKQPVPVGFTTTFSTSDS